MRLKKAFTLIELLVVIAIIAILAAILFPVFAQAKAAAKKAAATSNLKQCGTATILYNDSNDDTFAMVGYSNGTNGVIPIAGSATPKYIYSVFDVTMPFSKSKELFQDPADNQTVAWRDVILPKFGAGVESPQKLVYLGMSPNFAIFEDTAVLTAAGGSRPNSTTEGDPVVSASALGAPSDTALFYTTSYTAKGANNKFFDSGKFNNWIPQAARNSSALGLAAYEKGSKYDFGRHNFAGAPRHSDGVIIVFSDTNTKYKQGTSKLNGSCFVGTTEFQPYYLPFDINGIPDGICEPNNGK